MQKLSNRNNPQVSANENLWGSLLNHNVFYVCGAENFPLSDNWRVEGEHLSVTKLQARHTKAVEGGFMLKRLSRAILRIS